MQRTDVTGGAVGGATHLVCDGKGIGRGVVVEDAAAGCPRHHSSVGVTVQCSLQTTVGARSWTGREEREKDNT